MTVKYIAMDGKSFDSADKCREYENKMGCFTIEYFVKDKSCQVYTYTGDGENFNLEYFINSVIAFRVIDNYGYWNLYLNHNFYIVRDSLYFRHNTPFIDGNNFNKWLSYNSDGELEYFSETILNTKERLQKLEKIQKNIIERGE